MNPGSRAEAPSGDVSDPGPAPRASATEGEASDRPRPVSERHHDVAARGVRMRVTEWHTDGESDATARAVLALPGLLTPRTSLRPIARILAQRFRVVAVDLPGFGDSEKP